MVILMAFILLALIIGFTAGTLATVNRLREKFELVGEALEALGKMQGPHVRPDLRIVSPEN
ncbi:MAG: hypothetical protein A2Y80_02075 [Deltaproteobacteria bacterium RBG_13_58_19]|nr:MAG: hypothetical protein A2Y80_02075 [Deltaproteobacteria bacterium RBG_13_58_19]